MIILKEKKTNIHEKISPSGAVDGLIRLIKDQQIRLFGNRYYNDDAKVALFCKKLLMYTFGIMSAIGFNSDDLVNRDLFQVNPRKLGDYVDKKVGDLIAKMNKDAPKA
jgi:hypothetical protein